MTMVLELTEQQKERLRRYAAQQGKAPQTQTKINPPFPKLVAYIAPDFDDPLPDDFWFGDAAKASRGFR